MKYILAAWFIVVFNYLICNVEAIKMQGVEAFVVQLKYKPYNWFCGITFGGKKYSGEHEFRYDAIMQAKYHVANNIEYKE